MATDGVDALLAAEDEANRLVQELTRLKEETESYRTAGKALDEAGKGTSQLASRLADFAGQLGAVIETMRSIGTPELLSGQETLGNELTTLRQALFATKQSVIETVAVSVDQVRSLAEKFESTERAYREDFTRLHEQLGALATTVRIDELGKKLVESELEHGQEIQSLKRAVMAATQDQATQLARATASLQMIRNFTITVCGLTSISLVLLFILLILVARG